ETANGAAMVKDDARRWQQRRASRMKSLLLSDTLTIRSDPILTVLRRVRPMFRRLVLLVSAALLALAVRPADPAAPPRPARDLLGEPLPAGALARLGTPRLFQPGVHGLTFSPDAKALASVGGDGVLRLHEVATGRLLWRLDTPRYPDQTPEQSLLSFSPNGK